MTAPPSPGVAHPPGFTLIEVLVALMVFGLLMTGLVQGAQFGIHAWAAQSQATAAQQDLETADRTLRRLVATIDPGVRAFGPPSFTGNPRSMGFTAALPAAVDAYGTRQADAVLSVDATHRLVLRWAPHFAAPTRPAPPRYTTLLAGVDHIDLAYWAADPPPGRWLDQWATEALPRLLRIAIAFPPGDPRRWPPILASVDTRP